MPQAPRESKPILHSQKKSRQKPMQSQRNLQGITFCHPAVPEMIGFCGCYKP